MKPPVAPQKSYARTIHDETLEDPWHWLSDLNDPDTLKYLQDENDYADFHMRKAAALQESVFGELKGRLQEKDQTLPRKDGPYFYYFRIEEGEQYYRYCRKKGTLSADEEVLIDFNQLAASQTYFDMGTCSHSPDHQLLAYSVDHKGDELYTLYVLDLSSGVLFDHPIERTYSAVWTEDSRSLLYVAHDKNHRPNQVYWHHLGYESDRLIYKEEDTRFFVDLYKSESRRFIFLASEGHNMSEWYYMNASGSEAGLKLIEPRSENHEYDVSDHDDNFVIRSNLKAKDFKIVSTPIDTPTRRYWKDIVGHKEGEFIESCLVSKDFMVINKSIKGLGHIYIYDWSDGSSKSLTFEDEAYEIDVFGNLEFDLKGFHYYYASPAKPSRVFYYDFETGEQHLEKKQLVPDPKFDENNYLVRRLYLSSHDGKEIPVTLLMNKDDESKGARPIVVEAYGAYGSSLCASFDSERFSYVDRGVVYALAHVRGGSDLGRHWYEEGKLLHKMNSFLDLVACCEGLIKEGIASADKIFIRGGSAGGMLVTAAANLRPDLFAGVVAEVPFVDVVWTMLNEDLPLTTFEYNEWGNPNEKIYFEYIKKYCPIQNITPKQYPKMLVTAGLNDQRVTYWEPAKYVAKLRHLKTDDQLLLLKTKMESGHMGATGRYEYLQEASYIAAFILQFL